jgi:predicted dehydrogenase
MISRILVVGSGQMGSRHSDFARIQFPDAEIKTLARTASLENFESSEGFIYNMEEVVKFEPQIAVIANPSTFHVGIALELTKLGAHLLIEKPLSASREDVVKLIESCAQKNSRLMVGYNLRFSPSLQFFREKIIENLIGSVLSVRCEVGKYLPSWRPRSDYRDGVSGKMELGGGVLLELSHEIDYLRWIFGEIDWIRATTKRQSSLEIDVEDSAYLILGFLQNKTNSPLVGSLNLDFIRHDNSRNCTAIGENGSLRWDGITGEVLLFEKDASKWQTLFQHSPSSDETYLAEWEEFVSSINKNKNPSVSGEDGLRVIEIVEAARSSAESGVQVSINRAKLSIKMRR